MACPFVQPGDVAALPVPPDREVHGRVEQKPSPDAAFKGTQNCAARTGMAPIRSSLAGVGNGASS